MAKTDLPFRASVISPGPIRSRWRFGCERRRTSPDKSCFTTARRPWTREVAVTNCCWKTVASPWGFTTSGRATRSRSAPEPLCPPMNGSTWRSLTMVRVALPASNCSSTARRSTPRSSATACERMSPTTAASRTWPSVTGFATPDSRAAKWAIFACSTGR